ncbi:MAG: response regulator [Candidatus Omnitrophica bacterium]|nr:response regulator [Candidatus Omnitrophota bacterium]
MEGPSKVLVIDDEEIIRNFLIDLLVDQGCTVKAVATGEAGYETAMNEDFDLIIIDFMLPGDDGLNIIEHIRRNDPDAIIIVITGYNSIENMRGALRAGAFDYVPKPFDLEQMTFAVRRALASRHHVKTNKRLMKEVSGQNKILEEKVQERTQKLQVAYEDLKNVYLRIITALISAMEAKDSYTAHHSENVAKYSVALAKEMMLPSDEVELIDRAAQLHDIGKIGILDMVLNKPGKLTEEEFDQIKQHPLKAGEILKPLDFLGSAIQLVTHHHERYDGRGYPFGTPGDQIPLGARIIAVADTYDAIMSERPYRVRQFTKEECIEEIRKNIGSQFDPKVVAAFMRIVDNF